jgi:hypothetical protein
MPDHQRTTADGEGTENSDAYSFVRKVEREFWLDPDGRNRWIPTTKEDGTPRIEDHQDAGETCAACGTEIRWLCFVSHPTRGAYAVGRCCIHKVIRALPEDRQASYREAVSSIDRAMRNVTRRAQGKPQIVSRKDRLRAQISGLESAASDPRVAAAQWIYNGNQHRLHRDVLWYLSELKQGRRHSGFQSALKLALAAHGHPEVFA